MFNINHENRDNEVRSYDKQGVAFNLFRKKTYKTYECIHVMKNVMMYFCVIMCALLGYKCYNLHVENEKLNKTFDSIKTIEEQAGVIDENADMSTDAIVQRYKQTLQNDLAIKAADNDLTNKLAGITADMREMELQNASLVASNNQYYSTLLQYAQRDELNDKYGYALFNSNGQRTDITYDQLVTSEKIMVDNQVDPNLLYSIVMVESTGTEKASNSGSTAAGYGQILCGTGRSVYENIMGNGKGSFSYNMLYNGETNLEICANYLTYLIDTSNNIYSVIRKYRGCQDDAYCAKLDSYLRQGGTSLAKLNGELYSGQRDGMYACTTPKNIDYVETTDALSLARLDLPELERKN